MAATLFLSPDDVATLVRRIGLPGCLQGLVQALRDDFLRWPRFEKSARLASHSPVGVIELMPVSDGTTFSFKYVNGHPANAALGLPTVMAFGVLADVATGLPRFVCDLTLVTALRTAATSALAAQALARPGSRVMALVGNGAQGEFQALAFHHLLGIDSLRLHDIDPQAMGRLERRLRARGLDVQACADVAQAVRGADIVTTATARKVRAALITPDLVVPGMHLNAIGGDCPGKTELHPDVLRNARVFVEYEPQTRLEGDLQLLPPDLPVTELWEVLGGGQPGRLGEQDITVFDSVGFALEDFSALRYLQAQAIALGVGRELPLVPDLADPKDLFSLLEPPGT
ncbi:ornithine cyclodeaminase [Ramlibacter sp. MAHUQ-53]|uniref:ornithine cyclodeaminase n=1 Tax=unclassified Ramlibacter TaxID=2617605 RepID=UPI0036364765